MKSTLRATGITVMISMLAACSSLTVLRDFDPSADFSQYKTWAFISEHPMMIAEAADPVNPLTEGRFMQAISNSLNRAGLQQVDDPEQADIAVAFTLGSREKIRVDSYPTSYRMGYNSWAWGRPYHQEVTVTDYTQGQFALDLYDVQRRAPVWHGKATKTITTADRNAPVETITEIVDEVLAEFPPG
jgi:hypothetical protein